MKRFICSLIISTFACLNIFGTSSSNVNIVPLPNSITETGGKFVFNKMTPVWIDSYQNDSISKTFSTIQRELQEGAGTIFKPSSKKKSILKLILDKSLAPEAYTLDVTDRGILIKASRPVGFFYALQTLRQLLPAVNPGKSSEIPTLKISDKPRMAWRGFMLDEGRHFFGKDEVKKVIDIMATYKMNRFHWHLTEDQGWRIEIKKYPKLTETGAKRATTKLGWGDKYPADSIPYDGFYTQDDICEIVAYAKDRFIEIIPEIDIPGHSQAAVAAYPEILACDPENPHSVWETQGISDDVINVANPKAVEMMKDVIDEIIPLFPFPLLHLGGDECPTDKWRNNDQCRKRLIEIGSDNYRDLQLDFYNKIASHINAKSCEEKRRLVFWNEVLHGNVSRLPEDIVIMAWPYPIAEKDAADAVAKGFETILTPQIPYYINRKQSKQESEPLSQGGGTETLERVYKYQPMKDVSIDDLPKYLGVQGNFWSEYVVTPDFLEYLMLPRLTAIAEAAWTDEDLREYNDYLKRMKHQVETFKAKGLNFCPHEILNNQ